MDKILIQYEADLSKLKAQFDQLEAELRGVDASSKKSAKEFEENFNKSAKGIDSVDKGINRLNKSVANAGKTLVAAFAFDRIVQFTKSVVDITAKFQKFEAVLTNTLGSKSAAQKALTMIKDFAASTPFAVEELTASYVKLANQGFKPTAEEMRKLGDLAAAMGKGFDQLTEAIIDAQTGEFERLKEFGIRASKEGDKVKFTFKGVETQTNFTADAIRKYVLGLGDLAGVSGGMAAISKTLGGQISNLGDSFDALQVALGDRFKGAISGSISAVGDLITSLTELAAVPLSEKLEDERIGFNALVTQIISTNQGTERRKELVDQLNAQYKEYLPNLITETTSNADLAKILKDVNEQMVKKILIAEEDEKIQEKAGELAKAQRSLYEREVVLTRQLAAEASRLGIENKTLGKSFQEQADIIDKALGRTNFYGFEVRQLASSLQTVKNEEDALVKAQQAKLDLMNRLYGGQKEANEQSKETIETTEKETDAKVKQTEFEKILAAEREKIRKKELEDRAKSLIRFQELQKEELAGDIDPSLREANITKFLQGEAEKRHKIRLAEMKKYKKEVGDPLIKESQEAEKKITDKLVDEINKRKELMRSFAIDFLQKTLDAGVGLVQQTQDESIQAELESVKAKEEEELRILDERRELNLVSEDIYEKKKRAAQERAKKEEAKIKTKDAQNDKKIALFKIAIDTAAAIVKAILTSPITFGQPFAGFALATGAVQAALVAAQPIPKFKTGVVRLNGKGTHTSDSNLAMLSKDESVIPAKQSIEYEDELRAMHKGFYKKYIEQKYVTPALRKMELDRGKKEQSMARNMSSMLNLMRQNEFYDGNIINAIKKKDTYRMSNVKELAREIGKSTGGRTQV